MRDSGVARIGRVVGPVLHPGLQAHEGRHGTHRRPHHPGHRGPEGRPSPGGLTRLPPAGLAHEVGMVVDRVADRPDHRVAMGLPGQQGQVLAHLEARHGGRDGPELAADLGRGVHLEVEGVLVRRPTRQIHHDDGLVVGPESGGGLGAQQLGQRQAAQSEPSDAEEAPPGEAITESAGRSGDGQHGD